MANDIIRVKVQGTSFQIKKFLNEIEKKGRYRMIKKSDIMRNGSNKRYFRTYVDFEDTIKH